MHLSRIVDEVVGLRCIQVLLAANLGRVLRLHLHSTTR